MSEYTSTSRDNRVEQVLNADVVVHDLWLDTVDLPLLLLQLLLQLSQLVLKWGYYLLSNSLLFFQLWNTGLALFLPVLVLLVHAVNIVSYEINWLSQGISALAQNLDGLLHELDIILGETLACSSTSFFLHWGRLSSNLFTESLLLVGSSLLSLLTKFSYNLDSTTSCSFILTLRSALILLFLH